MFGGERGVHAAQLQCSHVLRWMRDCDDPPARIEDLLGRLSTSRTADIARLTTCAWAAARK